MGPGLPLRSFLALLAAAAPPAAAAIIAAGIVPAGATAADMAIIAGGVALASLAWLALVAVTFSRAIRAELAAFLELAERGQRADAAEGGKFDGDAAQRRLAMALDERNRQVAELATQGSRAPIGGEPWLVAQHVVRAARSVSRDETWVLVVLNSATPDRLPAGVYGGTKDEMPPGPLTELHHWALVASAEGLPERTIRIDGPWGAFTVISLAADDELRAALLAPWEGRTDPSSAEMALLSLIGEHAATAIQHAILYARVHAQAEAIDRMASVQRDFLRAVSHDLQTPLTSIRAVAAEVRAQPALDEQARIDLDLIEHQTDRLRRMVAQLLVVSRLEAGVVEPVPEVLNPRPLIERTWVALRAVGSRMEVEVTGPSYLAVADPDRLEQVLWAVMDNAVKYSPGGGTIHVRIGSVDGRASISISDEGMGMDADTVEMAFDQFFRANDARRVAPDGSGIGLYAARGLMEAMGGSIAIQSQLGTGTTLTLELPAEIVGEGVVTAHREGS